MSETPRDRRASYRAPVELKVEYKRLNTFFADYTSNISKGGTFICADRPLEVGTELVFALSIRPLPEPLRLRGRVRWTIQTDQATDDSPAGMGVEFLYANDEERRAAHAIVEGLMVDQLGEPLSTALLGHKPAGR